MFVNKVGNLSNNQTFKGISHEKNNAGESVIRFYYPAENTSVRLYKVAKSPNHQSGYEVSDWTPIKNFNLDKDGTVINPREISGLKEGEAFAYQVFDKNGNALLETGNNIRDTRAVLITQNGTTPTPLGAGYFTMPSTYKPGVTRRKFDEENTGEIYTDKQRQLDSEGTIRNFANQGGGSLAGLEQDIPRLKEMGIDVLFTTPTGGGDNYSDHHYWTNNNKHIPISMGNTEDYKSFLSTLFANGMSHVFDGTFTSEGLGGTHFQYALRHGKNAQSYYWFKMTGLENGPLSLGTVPKHEENLRHRVINAPVIYNPETRKVEKNPNYKSNEETLIQLYDGSQVTDEQLSELDKPIDTYKKIKTGNFSSISYHDDTLINYTFEINPDEYIDQLKLFAENNKATETPIVENSPRGTIEILQFSNFKITRKADGGFVTWDANMDMVKKNYGISGYDSQVDQAIEKLSARDYEKKMRERGAIEVQDLALQDVRYWAEFYRDAQVLYTAKILQNANTKDAIDKLQGIPKKALLTDAEIKNVLADLYIPAKESKLPKDDLTVKSVMKLPLDSLEFDDKTIGVLSTSYFTNLATKKDQLGLTRFELMQKDNPHLVEPYEETYEKVNELFTGEIKNFADEVIKKLNEISEVKLLDEKGEYTHYGKEVVEMFGKDIAKYAFLKAVRGESLETKVQNDGQITYDYKDLLENTSLKKLGIDAASPKAEAEALLKLIKKGLNNFTTEDSDYLAKAIAFNIEGTDAKSFAIAKAMVHKAGIGLSLRLDAAKDIIDMDAVRSRKMDFDEAWNGVIAFYKRLVAELKKVNPDAYVVAEITNVDDLIRDIVGQAASTYDIDAKSVIGKDFANVKEALLRFFVETGVTSEAAYSYFFTDLLKVFSAEFEQGTVNTDVNEHGKINRISDFTGQWENLVKNRSVDFIRNLYTFAGNHDKPRMIHGMALDMGLFHSNNYLNIYGEGGEAHYDWHRGTRQEILNTLAPDMPIEAVLNIDNPEYFKSGISTRAVAMSKLLRNSINNTSNKRNKDVVDALRQATVDLANANFKDSGANLDFQTIKIPELSSIQNAATAMIDLAIEKHGLNINKKEKEDLIKNITNTANQKDKTAYAVHGDYNWGGSNEWVGKENQQRIERILRANDDTSGETEYMPYHVYTVNLTALIRDSFDEVYGGDETLKRAFYNAQKDFVKKYNRETVENSRVKLPVLEDSQIAMRKNAYGARDILTNVQAVVEQAEYILGKSKDKKHLLNKNGQLKDRDAIITSIFRFATEPAVTKACMLSAFLSANMGISTTYAGDELGMSGYDEKSKNVYLQNRNTLWHSLLDNKGPLGDYIRDVNKRMNAAISIRARDGVKALSNGTPYVASTSNQNIPALMMYNADQNVTLSLFNATAIDPHSDSNYHKRLNDKELDDYIRDEGIDSISKDNPYVPMQPRVQLEHILLPLGVALPATMEFVNTISKDQATYKIDTIWIDGVQRQVIKNKNGTIAMDGITAPNGVMVLADSVHVEKDRTERITRETTKKEAEKIAPKAKKLIKPEPPNKKTVTKPEIKSETPISPEQAEGAVKKFFKNNKKALAIGAASVAVIAAGYAIIKNSKKKKEAKKELNMVV